MNIARLRDNTSRLDEVFTGMYTLGVVSPKQPYTLKIDPELLEALRAIKERDDVAESVNRPGFVRELVR